MSVVWTPPLFVVSQSPGMLVASPVTSSPGMVSHDDSLETLVSSWYWPLNTETVWNSKIVTICCLYFTGNCTQFFFIFSPIVFKTCFYRCLYNSSPVCSVLMARCRWGRRQWSVSGGSVSPSIIVWTFPPVVTWHSHAALILHSVLLVPVWNIQPLQRPLHTILQTQLSQLLLILNMWHS